MEKLIEKIRILVVDDHHVLRKGLIGLLHCNDIFNVVGEASNGKETLIFLKDYELDVVLLDIEMPEMNGRETLINIKKKFPHVKVIMFTTYDDISTRNYFMEHGADAYLVKNSSFEVISETIVKVVNGNYFNNIENISDAKISDEFLQLALTEIEKRIIVLLCESHNNKTMSKVLNMSENTIKYHRKNIYTKTRTKSITELVVYAIKQGIIILN